MMYAIAAVMAAKGGFVTRFWSNIGFTTAQNDPLYPGAHFDGRLAAGVEYNREVTCIAWGPGRSSGGLGALELINRDGALDVLTEESIKGRAITLYRVPMGMPSSSWTLLGSATATKPDSSRENILKLLLADRSEILDRQVQTALFTAGSDQLKNQPLPFAFGRVLSAPVPLAVPADLDFQCNDSPFASVDLVRDQGLALDPPGSGTPGWEIRSEIFGFRKTESIAGKVVADLTGALSLGERDVTEADGTFTTWSAGEPAGFEVRVSGGGTVVDYGPGADFNCPSLGSAELRTEDALSTGKHWYSITLSECNGALIIACDDYTRILTEPGQYDGVFDVAIAARFRLYMDAPTRAIVTALQVRAAVVPERLPDVANLLISRAGGSVGEIDSASVTAVDAACPWRYCYWSQAQSVPVRQVLTEVMDSVLGWVYTDRFGHFRFGQLRLPATVADFAVTDVDMAREDIDLQADLAPGYSAILGAERNWYVHSDSDIAGAVSAADRTALQSDFRVRHTDNRTGGAAGSGNWDDISDSTGAVTPRVPGSIQGIGMASVLAYGADCYEEVYRRRVFWSEPRFFRSFSLVISADAATQIEPGQTVKVTSKRYGMAAGKNLLVIGARGRFGSGRVRIKTWG